MNQNPSISNTLVVRNFNFNTQGIPVWATINGIQVQVEWQGSNNNVVEERIQLTKNGTNWYWDNKSTWGNQTTKALSTYGWLTDLWGTTWSDTEIKSINFWVLLQYRKTGWGTRTADVYRVSITVDYTAPIEESPLSFTITQENYWQSGFCYQFTATNTWLYSITNWKIGFRLNGASINSSFGWPLTNLWWGNYEFWSPWTYADTFAVGQSLWFWLCANSGSWFISNLETASFDIIWWATLQDFSFQEGFLQVDVTTSSSFNGGYCRQITVENTWSELIHWWNLEFTLAQNLSSSFNGVFVRTWNIYNISPVWFNRIINPWQIHSIWFCTNGVNVDDLWQGDILIGEAWFCGNYYSWTAANPYDPNNLLMRRMDSEIMFNWGTWSPEPIIPIDDFTTRWTGSFQATENWVYAFRTRTDDGVRLYINGNIIIDRWVNQAPTINIANINLENGKIYDVVMEYYERWGGAVAELDWQKPSDGTFVSLNSTIIFDTLCSDPFPPTDIFLSDEFVLDGSIAWNLVGTFTTEDQSVIDTHTYNFSNGLWDNDNTAFIINNDSLIMNENVDFNIQTSYSIRVRSTDFGWEFTEKIFLIQVIPSGSENPWFCGNYYNWTANNPFQESNILLKRIDSAINFNWGLWSPDPIIPNDVFTVRWVWYIESDESWIHQFRTNSDDGARVFIDGQNIINQWKNQAPTFSFWSYTMQAGVRYRIVVEYYEAFWWAVMEFGWQKPSQNTYSILNQNNIFHLGNCDISIWDTIAPTIFSATPTTGTLFPSKNLDISLTYSDDIWWTWIDTNSAVMLLERWNGTIWENINGLILWDSITTTNGSYSLWLTTFGRYRYAFQISDNSWNTTQIENIFYIDEPSFQLSQWELDLWILINDTQNFSDSISIQIETIGAAYEIFLVQWDNLSNNLDIIDMFNWNRGYGYQIEPYNNTITSFWPRLLIAGNSKNINTNGEKNVTSYSIQIWAIIDSIKSQWLYEWNFDVEVRYIYEI